MSASAKLGAADLLEAAAICEGRSVTEAALYLAALDRSDLSLSDCARLPIGARDRGLVALREGLFGERLDLGAACPACAGRLDVSLTTGALAADALDVGSADRGGPPVLVIAGRRFRLRAADSRDFAAVARIADPEAGRQALARRCLDPLDGGPVPTLSAAALAAVADALGALDPAADPYVPLTCAACGHAWEAPVDIARVLADEIATAAGRLFDDVHDLALAYHWSEDTILALPPERRQAYLDRLRA